MKSMKKLLMALAFLPLAALASEAKIDVKAPVDLGDHESLQRGARTFVNYCLSCHSANYMRYNRLQDIGLTEKQIKDNLVFAGEKVGETMQVGMTPKDGKKWFGAAPPDLSVEVRARGADWVYAYLRGFYKDETRPSGWNNVVFDKVAMPHVFYELQGVQALIHETHQLELVKPGRMSPEEYDAFVGDLTNYMAYMAEPKQQNRKHTGIWVLLFLGVLFVFAKKLKEEYWKDIK
jgi:ubiquinol-cytochrome c reductase cytochrome c1 subunit